MALGGHSAWWLGTSPLGTSSRAPMIKCNHTRGYRVVSECYQNHTWFESMGRTIYIAMFFLGRLDSVHSEVLNTKDIILGSFWSHPKSFRIWSFQTDFASRFQWFLLKLSHLGEIIVQSWKVGWECGILTSIINESLLHYVRVSGLDL